MSNDSGNSNFFSDEEEKQPFWGFSRYLPVCQLPVIINVESKMLTIVHHWISYDWNCQIQNQLVQLWTSPKSTEFHWKFKLGRHFSSLAILLLIQLPSSNKNEKPSNKYVNHSPKKVNHTVKILRMVIKIPVNHWLSHFHMSQHDLQNWFG